MCPNVRLFLTGRFQIRSDVKKYFPGTAKGLPISLGEHDIGLYEDKAYQRPKARSNGQGIGGGYSKNYSGSSIRDVCVLPIQLTL